VGSQALVAHACNHSYWGGRVQAESWFKASLGK
jgi:hypothetical protein